MTDLRRAEECEHMGFDRDHDCQGCGLAAIDIIADLRARVKELEADALRFRDVVVMEWKGRPCHRGYESVGGDKWAPCRCDAGHDHPVVRGDRK